MTAPIMTVSRQLFSRPADERFASLDALLLSARSRQRNSLELDGIPASSLIFTGRVGNANAAADDPIRLTVDHPSAGNLSSSLRLTNYSLTQLCTAARAPAELLQRVDPRTAARVLNESIRSPRLDMSPRSLLLDTSDGEVSVRALTSERYARVWDSDVFGRVHEFLAPYGYRPATPTFNTADGSDVFGSRKPFLWSGDRDSFGFFYTEPDQNGADFGGLRRGIYVGNSEVGAGSLAWSTMIFRDICANAMIWGAHSIKSRRVRHIGQVGRLWNVYCRDLAALAREIEPLPLARIAAAAKLSLAGDGSPTASNLEAAQDRLVKQFGLGVGEAKAALQASLLPVNAARPGEPALSLWTALNGVTYVAKESPHASALVDAGKIAESMLASVP